MNYCDDIIALEDSKILRWLRQKGIEIAAYEKWEAAGRPEGKDLYFWLKAEEEWDFKKELTDRKHREDEDCVYIELTKRYER